MGADESSLILAKDSVKSRKSTISLQQILNTDRRNGTGKGKIDERLQRYPLCSFQKGVVSSIVVTAHSRHDGTASKLGLSTHTLPVMTTSTPDKIIDTDKREAAKNSPSLYEGSSTQIGVFDD